MKIRIKDIAALAGVSEGTVDRVLHNRGEVSDKSRAAVEKAVAELEYSPNLLARSLASKKAYRFVCLIPKYEKGDYWQVLDEGFDAAATEYSQYNVSIEKKYFDQFDGSSFAAEAQALLSSSPDGVIMAPVFRPETIRFCSQLDDKEIPFSFIDSIIEEAGFLSYYGQNSFHSGYTAAKLLTETLPAGAGILVTRTLRKEKAVSNQTANRYAGFMKYLEDSGIKDSYRIVDLEMKDDDEALNIGLLAGIFDGHPHIKAAVTFNSKVYRLAMHIKSLGKTGISLLGYDLPERNVAYLHDGTVSHLIGQRPEKQAYCAVSDMCRVLIFGQQVNRINYMPIDILIKENIDYYLNFKD